MFEYVFVSISLLLLSLAMLGMVYWSKKIARGLSVTPIIIDLIFFFIFVKILLYYLLPAFMRILSGYQFERQDQVDIFSLVTIYSIEFISWSCWLTSFLVTLSIFNKKNKIINSSRFFYNTLANSKIVLSIIALGFILIIVSSLTRAEISPFFEPFKALFYSVGLTTGPMLMILSLKYLGKKYFYLGLLTSLFGLLGIPTRGAVVYFVLFCLFLVWYVLKDKKSKIIIIGTISLLVATYFIFGGLVSEGIFVNGSGTVQLKETTPAEKQGVRSALEEIEWRFGASTRMGTAFLRMYDRGDAAGILPIKHSLMGFLPRSINPEKPIPNTIDPNDIYSQGMYLIYREIHGYDTYSMTEFPTGAHFYWEFGVLGVIFLSAISGLYVALCAHFFSKLGLVALPLMVAVFKPWGYMDPKIWVSDIVTQIYQIILPLILLLFIIRFVRYGSKVLVKFITYAAAPNKRSDLDVNARPPS